MGQHPKAANMTASEVLTWIAVGIASTKEALAEATHDRLARWNVFPMAHLRDALAGRAGHHPYCAVLRVALPAHPPSPHYACKSVSPNGPALLRSIRAAARRRLGRLVSYPELLAMLDQEMQREADDDAALDRATATLMDALRRGTITAYGIPSDGNGDARIGAPHEPVPLTVLMGDNVTVDLFDQITIDIAGAAPEWMRWRRNTYHRVRFQTADVLSLWPAKPAPRITLEDLPADWTLIEAMAWITLRNPAVVHDAAPETMREGGTFHAEHRLPDGRTEMVAETGQPGIGMVRLTMLATCAKRDDPMAQVLMPHEAEAAFLASLRAGKLTAYGTPQAGDPREMEPRDWRGLLLHERPHGTLIAEPSGAIGQRWENVTLPRDAVVILWPPQNAPDSPSAAPVHAVKPARQNKGGRRERDDWQPFDHEIARRLALDGGDLTLTKFRRMMKEWAAENMQPVPDDRTIERRIDARAPPDVFAPD
jgi:hypothetical protein